MCLGVNALALVLNENFRKLVCLELWWLGGIYSPQPPKRLLGEVAVDGHTGQSGAQLDRSCSLSGEPPCHPTIRVQSRVDRWGFVLLRHLIVRCHTGQSGAPLTLLL
jgi:hypothetical protein